MTSKKTIIFIPYLITAFTGIALSVCISSVMPLFPVFLSLICLKLCSNKKTSALLYILSLIFILYLYAFPASFSGVFKWQYPIQKQYIKAIHGLDTSGFFPDTLPDNAEDFKTEFFPSIMQGAGHYFISFTLPDEYCSEIIQNAAENSVMTVSAVNAADNSYSEEETALIKALGKDEYSVLSVYIPEEFQSSESALVYIYTSNFNFNHPHTEALIADGNRICYSRLG